MSATDKPLAEPGRSHAYRSRGKHKNFFSIADVAKDLRVSTRTVRRWIRDGQLVPHRFGAAVRIAESDLWAFIAQHRAP
jgi:excisionase family DNA binding protein